MRMLLLLVVLTTHFCWQQHSSLSFQLLAGFRAVSAISHAPRTAAVATNGWFQKKDPTVTITAAAASKQRILKTLTGLRAGYYNSGDLLGDDDNQNDATKEQQPEEQDYSLPPTRPYIKYPSARRRRRRPPDADDENEIMASTLGDDDDESKTLKWQPPQQKPASKRVARRALILMDAFCDYHGLYLADRILQDENNSDDETAVIFVLSDYLRGFLLQTQPENAAIWQAMRLPRLSTTNTNTNTNDKEENEAADADRALLQQWTCGLEIVGVYCESDSGLHQAEELRQLLNVQHAVDDPPVLLARRDKFLMNQHLAAKTNLPVARQALCSTIQQARDFCLELGMSSATDSSSSSSPCRVVVKPCRGVASEDVRLCRSLEQVQRAFDTILGSPIFGSSGRHEAVLLQEYLVGREYAVDVVVGRGHGGDGDVDCDYKVAAVWRYDKRPNVNPKIGVVHADFCYFQTELVDADMDPTVAVVCDYVIKALQALGIKQGLSHTEVIVTNDGRGTPVLVEINCRQHNMDFIPLTMICIGYNALDMTLTALLGTPEEWDSFPDMATLQKGRHGCMVHLVNSNPAGSILKRVQYLDEMSQLPSFLNGQVYPHYLQVGSKISPTIDIKSDAGWIQLVHEDKDQLDKDYQQILEWMPTMFEVEKDEPDES